MEFRFLANDHDLRNRDFLGFAVCTVPHYVAE